MQYFKQETNYTCGPACARMVLSHFDIESTEAELAIKMGTLENSGSDYSSFQCLKDFGLEFMTGEGTRNKGTLDKLNQLLNQGYAVVMAYSLDVPHFSVYLGHNNNHLFLNDPFRGERIAMPIKKFLYRWRIIPEWFRTVCIEYDLNFEGKESEAWWIAFKKL
jgi:predicted double-glycine peptidase